MIPAPTYDQIDKILNEESFKFGDGYALGVPKTTKTVGFLIFDQNFRRSSIYDLVGNLDMLNIYSGTNIHFFMCGVSKYGPNDNEARELGSLNGITLYHNAKSLYSFINTFQKEIPGWTYDLGFDLILIDVTDDQAGRNLNFESAVFFKVEELIKVGIIERPSDLIGKVVKFARDGKFLNAVAFRDELKTAFGINWLKGLILAMFPKSVGKLARAQVALGGSSALSD